jgi:hypothetical protein
MAETTDTNAEQPSTHPAPALQATARKVDHGCYGRRATARRHSFYKLLFVLSFHSSFISFVYFILLVVNT